MKMETRTALPPTKGCCRPQTHRTHKKPGADPASCLRGNRSCQHPDLSPAVPILEEISFCR